MVNLGEYIKRNYTVFEKLVNRGKISLSVKQEFEIYQFYNTTSHIKSKMQRYTATAEAMRVSESTVRNCVSEMKKVI